MGFCFPLIFFVVAYIDNAFLSMCAVLVSIIFVSLLDFVHKESFQDVFQSPFSLILMFRELLELLMFSIATYSLPQSEDIIVVVVIVVIIIVSLI